MALTLSGRLYDPFGNALENAGIRFRAASTSSQVLATYGSEAETDSSGDYSVTVRYGTFHIEVRQSERSPWYTIARNITISVDTTSTDINSLIVAYMGEGEATPAIVLQIEAIRDDAQAAADLSEIQADRSQSYAEQSAGFASDARSSAMEASAIYEDTESGIAATSDRQFFYAPSGDHLVLYQNESGVAVAVMTVASNEALERVSNIPDPILTSLIL